MNTDWKSIRTIVLAALLVLPIAAGAQGDAEVRKDLATVIALQGKSCGKVIKADKQGENDYVCHCESGDRYRVTVDENDRVVVKKL